MRKAGMYYNDPAIQLGKVLANGKIKVGDLPLEKEDYFLDCNLRLNADKKIYLHTEMTDSVTNMKEYKNNILNEGDKVLVLKIKSKEVKEKFVIIAKVVEPE